MNLGQQQVGGEILGGHPARDVRLVAVSAATGRRQALSVVAGCPNPALNTSRVRRGERQRDLERLLSRAASAACRCASTSAAARAVTSWCYSQQLRGVRELLSRGLPRRTRPTRSRMTDRHKLDIRYRARYGDALDQHAFYLVRDTEVVHGTGNWVFVSGAACGVDAPAHPGIYHWLPHPDQAPSAPVWRPVGSCWRDPSAATAGTR